MRYESLESHCFTCDSSTCALAIAYTFADSINRENTKYKRNLDVLRAVGLPNIQTEVDEAIVSTPTDDCPLKAPCNATHYVDVLTYYY